MKHQNLLVLNDTLPLCNHGLILGRMERLSVYPLILVGDSGVGKSTVARAYAQKAGFDILESHADAKRDAKHFNKTFSEARNRTFFGQNRCLIVEDAGAISASAWKTFDDAISAKAFPMVIIAQHESEVGWRYRKSGLVHEIPAPTSSDKVQLLNSICPDHTPEQIWWIAENSSSWRSAKHLAITTPPDFVDPNVQPRERTHALDMMRYLGFCLASIKAKNSHLMLWHSSTRQNGTVRIQSLSVKR